MIFTPFEIWATWKCFGFSILEFDTIREDEIRYSLFGIQYDKEEKILEIDIFWRGIEFNFNKK